LPLHDYQCQVCKQVREVISFLDSEPKCCDVPMIKLPSFPVLVKMKGDGGLPSLRKMGRGTAPYTSSRR
jgi:hypothetical protein